jgi:hypothetical protein
VKLKCVNDENKAICANNTMIAAFETNHSLITDPSWTNQFWQWWYCLHSHSKFSPYAIWIERNEPMEYAEHHTEKDKSEKSDRKFVSSFLK